MKRLFAGLFVWCNLLCGNAFHAAAQNTIVLSNTSSVALHDNAVTIKRSNLSKIPVGVYYPVIITQKGDTIASQVDDMDGDGLWDELFFVADLPASKSVTLKLNWSKTDPAYIKRTSIRFGVRRSFNDRVVPAISDTFYANQLPDVIGYQRYQTDGPTWENDMVGFRQYLDGRNAIDVFGKKQAAITPGDVGINSQGVTEPTYSAMQDWGTDILAVGSSVGIGGATLMIGDSLVRIGITKKDTLNNVDSTLCHIVTEGPVRSVMQIDYRGWKPLQRNYAVKQTTSTWPGMHAFNNSVSFDKLEGDETLVVSLVNVDTQKKLGERFVNDKWVVLFTHDKQSVDKKWWLGLALILPRENYAGYIEAPKSGSVSGAYLGKLKLHGNTPVNYFAVACWELRDARFNDAAYFEKYITDLANQLAASVTIKIN